MLYLHCPIGGGAGTDVLNPFHGGKYRYMDQLEKLCQYVPPAGRNQLPERFARITTPLKAEVWELELRDLPDERCAQFVIRGISEGFRIGF